MPPMIAYDFLFGSVRNRSALTISAFSEGGGHSPENQAVAQVTPPAPPALWTWVKGLLRWPAP